MSSLPRIRREMNEVKGCEMCNALGFMCPSHRAQEASKVSQEQAIRADERSRLAAQAPEGALLTDFDMITALDEPCVAFSDPRLIQWRAITKAQLAAVWTIFQAKLEQAVKVERERAIQEVGELVDEYIGGGNYRVYVPNWKATVGGISADLEYVWGELKKAIEALKSGKQEAKS